MTGLREGFHTTPTIEVTDVDLDEADWQARRADLECLSLGPLGRRESPHRFIPCGTHYGMNLLVPVQLSLQWFGHPPEGWATVTAWVMNTEEWFESQIEPK